MDINAANIDDAFKGLLEEEIRKQFGKVMKDHCRVCSSKVHKSTDSCHHDTVCRHCGKPGHWAMVCLHRLTGKPAVKAEAARVATVASTSASGSSSSGSSDDRDTQIAALKDQLESMQKALSGFV